MVITYQLRAAVLALRLSGDDKPHLETIPAGSRLTLAGAVRESGLVDIQTEDPACLFTVFHADLVERAERIDAAAGV